jgi:hypothetical protein
MVVLCSALAAAAPATAAAATSYSELILEDAPRVYLPLDERTGSATPNLGSGAVEAFVNGDVTVAPAGALEAAEGNKSFQFDGDAAWWGADGDYVELRAQAGESVIGTFTVEGWVKLDRHAWIPELFNLGAEVRLDQDGIYTNAGSYAPGLPLDEWHHVALTTTPQQIELFVDGVSRGARPTATTQIAYGEDSPLTIGWRVPGAIDEVAVYDRVLAPDRIAARFQAGSQGFDAQPPTNRTAPKVSGADRVGATATCDPGTWTGVPRELDVRWLRDGAPIGGAIDRSYTLTSADLGHTIRCDVVARNVAGESPPVVSQDAIVLPTSPTPSTYRQLIAQDNPRMYLPLNEATGTTTPNLGSDGGDALIHGDPQTGVYGALEGDEPSDRAFRLDGNDYLTYRPAPGVMVHGDFTAEGWIKHEEGGYPRALYNNHADMSLRTDGIATYAGRFHPATQPRRWYHVVGVGEAGDSRTPGWFEVFVDGVSLGRLPYYEGTVYNGDWLSQTMGWGLPGWLDEMAIYDYKLTPERIAEHHRRGTTGFGATTPANRAVPTVSGDAVVGRTATCDEGDWSGGPREFDFRWLRDGEPIPRATEKRYSLAAHDLGHEIRCDVAARNLAGTSAPRTSANAIAMPAPRPDSSYRNLILDDNARMYLPLDERSGTELANLGSDGGAGQIHGNPRLGVYGALESDESGDRAIRLDGDDYLTYRPERGVRVQGDFTAEGWIKHEEGGYPRALYNNHADMSLRTDGIATYAGRFQPATQPRRWYHVVGVVEAGDRDSAGWFELFVDGVSLGRLPYGDGAVYDGDWLSQTMGWGLPGWLDEMAIYDYKLTPERIAEHHRRGTTGFGAPPPVNRVLPRPAGDAIVGRTATCEVGTWTGGPREFGFRWLRDGAAIDGATEQRYTISAEDLGSRITCAVVARNLAGASSEAVSTAAIVVPGATRPADYRALVQLDRPALFLPLTHVTDGTTPNLGYHGGDAIVRGDASRAGGAIADDPDPSLHIAGDDNVVSRVPAGAVVDGEWTAEGWVYLESHAGDPHLFNNAANLRLGSDRTYGADGRFEVVVQPGAWHHVVLTHHDGDRDSAGETELWVDGVSIVTKVSGPLGPVYYDRFPAIFGWGLYGAIDELAVYEYRLTPNRIRTHYRAGIDGMDTPYPTPDELPAVTGTARVGESLTCENGTWDGDPTFFEYRWLRGGTVVPGADGSTYAVTSEDGGNDAWCEIRATNERGASSWVPSSNRVAVPRVPRPVTSPAVTGDPWPGRRVTCAIGGWTDGGEHEVRWELDGAIVAGVPGDRYDVTGPEGGRLRCLVQMTGAGGTSSWIPSEAVVIDGTPPVVALECPSGFLSPGDDAVAEYTASDAHSGLADPGAGTVRLDTTAAGTHTASVTVHDRAGHATTATCAYRVLHPRPGAPVPASEISADGLAALTWSGSPEAARYELQASRDGGAWTDVATTTTRAHDVTAPLAEGVWRFRVRALDPDFDDAWSAESVAVVVDRTPPVIDLECPPAYVLHGSAAFATYTASDGGSGLVTPASAPVALDTGATGTRSARATARDRAGHTSEDTCTYEVLHRRPGAPEPATTTSTDGRIALSWPSLGAPDAARYELQSREGGGAWATVATTTSRSHTFAAPVGDGTWRFRVRAVDPAFEDAWSGESAAVFVDATPPAVEITCPPAPLLRDTVASATYTASDGGSGLVSPASGSVRLDTSAAGTHTARVTARDGAGHTATATCTYRVIHNGPGAPEPDRTASSDGQVVLRWPALGSPDAARYELQARRAGDATWPALVTTTGRDHTVTGLADGTWTFRVRALDGSFDDAWSPASAPVDVDRTAPVVDLTCPAAPVLAGRTAAATFTASDAGSGLATPASGSVALDTSTPGTFTARVTARDRAGHETEATCTYRVAHPTPGAPRLSGGHTSPTANGRLELTWTVDGGAAAPARYELQARNASGTWTTIARPASSTHELATARPDGTWEFRVRIDDPQFVSDWSPVSLPVKVDTVAPTAAVASSRAPEDAAGGWFKDRVEVTFASTDPALPDGSPGSGVDPASVATAVVEQDGVTTVTRAAVDRAGNRAATVTREVKVDGQAPVVTVTCPGPTVGYGDPAQATWTATDPAPGSGLDAARRSGTVTLDTTTRVGLQSSPAVTTTDRVGHVSAPATCSYDVRYVWAGWVPGAQPSPNWTQIPKKKFAVAAMRFRLARPSGARVTNEDPTVEQFPCPSGSGTRLKPRDDLAENLANTWAHDGADEYTWGMDVPDWPEGACGRLVLRLADGSAPHYTHFQIVK